MADPDDASAASAAAGGAGGEQARAASTHPRPPAFLYLYDEASRGGPLWSPPEPPAGRFPKFGRLQEDELASHVLGDDVRRFFDDADGHPEGSDVGRDLRVMNRVAMQRFLDLLALLVERPQEAADGQLEGLSHVLINMSLLLNRLRASQARQVLIAVLRRQVETRNRRADDLEKSVVNVDRFLAAHAVANSAGDGDGARCAAVAAAAAVAGAGAGVAQTPSASGAVDGGGGAGDSARHARSREIAERLDELAARDK